MACVITSTLMHQPFRYFCHKVSGTTAFKEVALAVQHTLQHDDVAVVWDLRDLALPADLAAYRRDLKQLVGHLRGRMSGARRVFVVADSDAAYALRRLIDELDGPWPWAVFDDWHAALDWLEVEGGAHAHAVTGDPSGKN